MPVATLGRDARPPEAGAPAHPPLHIRGLTKRYTSQGRTRTVLDGIELDVAPGEFVSVVGPSGCGKSTLLRVLAGLDADYDGSLCLGATEVRGPSLSRGIVFQDHRLLPWLTLEQNVALALKNVELDAAAKRERVRAHLELVGLDGSRDAWPGELSGGMAQRVAIARALVTAPDVLLLDEPLSALDALTRARLQDALLDIWQTQRVTMVLVTHDIEEALYLSQRIVVLSANPGRVERIVEVPIDYPRDRASYAFADMRREVGAAIAA
ncbi:ABC transporter ATP-binding protein [Burkholderia sp. Ac-20379]|uniref:ABC transporter ATP-binding protein n=1 Tax=Burkholderia sp. Ac-20379 TaxID=2703900 RepID=UPI00197E3AD4|nr:ABC transporter ATP-binding protein [Burkholderia sp. Ac-20379]MBN3727981.1 ABC transporter ATP-binding protein [Burkholderia sp. Ac-20379]